MRTHTYIFKDSIEENIPFKPMQTIVSEEFGRHFFIDIGFNFISAPSFIDGGYDASQLDYVGNWTELEGIDLDKLLDINRKLCWNQWQEDKDKAHTDMCEYMEAVENGEIQYL